MDLDQVTPTVDRHPRRRELGRIEAQRLAMPDEKAPEGFGGRLLEIVAHRRVRPSQGSPTKRVVPTLAREKRLRQHQCREPAAAAVEPGQRDRMVQRGETSLGFRRAVEWQPIDGYCG